MDNPRLVQTPLALTETCQRLRREPRFAVDTELNSLFAYREQVCLVQFSTPSEDVLVDPLAVPDLSPLGPILADQAFEKVFHAAEYDLICLRRDFGFEVRNIFDTMVAARALGEDGTGLGALLRKELGIDLDKRFQRANWGVRPLPADQLQYARLDTHYLLALRDRLEIRVREAGLWEEVQEDFQRVAEHSLPAEPTPREAGLWKIKGVFDLPRGDRAVLLKLHLFREDEAQRLDRPPFKIFSDETSGRDRQGQTGQPGRAEGRARAQPHEPPALGLCAFGGRDARVHHRASAAARQQRGERHRSRAP